MQAVVAEAPTNWEGARFVPELHLEQDRIIVLCHYGNPDKKNSDATARKWDELSRALLHCRRSHLMDYLLSALDSTTCVSDAVDQAFTRMNSALKALAEGEDAEKPLMEWHWRVQNNCMLVIVGHAHVYVFGDAGGVVVLCRDGVDERLTRIPPYDSTVSLARNWNLTKFRYFHKERLSEKDSHLVVGTFHAYGHCQGRQIAPVLLTRIQAFGLEEACRQLAGYDVDYTRTVVVVPLGDLLRGKVARGVVQVVNGELYKVAEDRKCDEPKLGWGLIGPNDEEDGNWEASDSEDSDSEDEDSEDEDYEVEDYGAEFPNDLLFPLVNGKPQTPEPLMSCKFCRVPRRHPSIRIFDQEGSRLTVTSKYKRCTIVITQGNILEWSVDGKRDAIVNCIGGALHSALKQTIGDEVESVLVGDVTSHSKLSVSRVIHTQGPPYCAHDAPKHLAETYKDVLSLALSQRIKFIAFPAISCGAGSFPASEAAEIAIKAIHEHIGKKKIIPKNKKVKEHIQVHFVLSTQETWRSWVAATDLLSYQQKPKPKPCRRLSGPRARLQAGLGG